MQVMSHTVRSVCHGKTCRGKRGRHGMRHGKQHLAMSRKGITETARRAVSLNGVKESVVVGVML